MREIESTYSGFDETKMFLRAWVPDGEPRVVVIGVHGLGSHSGLLEFMGTTYANKGMLFYAPDLRGFGHFEGIKGHVESFDNYLEDLQSLVNQVKVENPGKKLFMYGHSFGGLVTVHYAAKYQENLDGIITSCPAVSERLVISSGKRMLMTLLSKINTKKHFTTGLDLNLLSRNPAVVKRNEDDPLRFDFSTARMGAEGLNASHTATDLIAPKITIPVIVQQAGDDMILDPDKNKLFYDAIASEDKTWKLYEGLYHEPFEDPGGGEEVLSDMFSWLEAHL